VGIAVGSGLVAVGSGVFVGGGVVGFAVAVGAGTFGVASSCPLQATISRSAIDIRINGTRCNMIFSNALARAPCSARLNERASAPVLIVMVEIDGLSIVNKSEVGFDPVLETNFRLAEL
jgi:hypothetical protein